MRRSTTNEPGSRWRTVAALAIGIAIGWATLATPAGGHVTQSVGHVRNHMAKFFFTKAESNARAGRIAVDILEGTTTASGNMFTASWTHTITPGLATGNIKVDASMVVTNHNASPCAILAQTFVDGTQATNGMNLLIEAGDEQPLSLTGAVPVNSSAAKTVEVRVTDLGTGITPCGDIFVQGRATSAYFPFGPTGA